MRGKLPLCLLPWRHYRCSVVYLSPRPSREFTAEHCVCERSSVLTEINCFLCAYGTFWAAERGKKCRHYRCFTSYLLKLIWDNHINFPYSILFSSLTSSKLYGNVQMVVRVKQKTKQQFLLSSLLMVVFQDRNNDAVTLCSILHWCNNIGNTTARNSNKSDIRLWN